MVNRSVPVDTVLPHVFYQDLGEAIPWLTEKFGFVEHYRYGAPDGTISGAQMHFGDAWIMVSSARPGRSSPKQVGCGTQMLTIFVPDVESHYRQSKAAGATIVEELNETIYGERQYGVEDLDGHRWLFSQHARDVDPRDWGATVAR